MPSRLSPPPSRVFLVSLSVSTSPETGDRQGDREGDEETNRQEDGGLVCLLISPSD